LDTVRRFPARLQQLAGFGVYRGLIGHIDKDTPANRLLQGSEDARMLWDNGPPPG
jgi:ectoine hydroxylase-related dioxygenase (phytanoyl-CoA dioxygenase family)